MVQSPERKKPANPHADQSRGPTGSHTSKVMSTTQTHSPQGAKPRRAPQNAEIRHHQLTEFDDALATIGQIEASAGPTLREELGRSKRVQAAYQSSQDREQFRRRRLGHRSGLVRLMVDELGADPAFSDRAWSYVHQVLMVSANVAAVTGSSWKSTMTWLRSNVPAITDEMGVHMKAAFDAYVEEAQVDLARRIPSGDPNLFTGPMPADIAKELGTTNVQLRRTGANRSGLTSIDAPDRKVTDKKRKADAREKAGMRKQGDRSDTAVMKDLAGRMGWSLAKAYRKRDGQPLDAFVAAHSHDEKEVSALIRTLDGGQIFLTPPANDDDEPVVVTPPITETGYIGRNMQMDASEVRYAISIHPALNDDLKRHLDAIDTAMVKTPAENHRVVRRNLLKDRNLLAHRERRAREKAAAMSEFIGRNITLTAEEATELGVRYPALAEGLHNHLAELEGPLSRVPPPNRKRALRRMMGARNKLVRSRQRFDRVAA